MFKRLILLLSLALLVPTTAIHAAKPETFLGKLGASAIQFTNYHRDLLTFPVVIWTFNRINNPNNEFPTMLIPALISLFPWCIASNVLNTSTKALMQNFDIDPIK